MSAVLVAVFTAAALVQGVYLTRRGTSAIALRRDAKVAIVPFSYGDAKDDWRTGYGLADVTSR